MTLADSIQSLYLLSELLHSTVDDLTTYAEQLIQIANALRTPASAWAFPVGSDEFPVEMWYCAQYHTYNRDTNPRGHTGLDLNLDVSPWGDVDRGQPVFALAGGVVHDSGYSPGWLGVVVIRVEHKESPLWVRYAHLDWNSVPVSPGDPVVAGQELGCLGDYSGGDHLHLDMAITPFGWNYWRSRAVHWIDPVPILQAHLDTSLVDAMLTRRASS